MVVARDIVDRESLRAWLDGRPEETRQADAVAIASRAVMRVMPVYVSLLGGNWEGQLRSSALPVLRCILTSDISQFYPTTEVKNASLYAADLAREDTPSADYTNAAASASAAAYAAATGSSSTIASASVDYASSLNSELWEQVRIDAGMIGAGQAPFFSRLWLDGPRERDVSNWDNALRWLGDHPGHDFWIRWYEAALDGRPLTGDWDSHWQMLRDIALIPNEDWEQGAGHVAGLIDIIAEKNYIQTQIKDLKQRISDEIFNQQSLGQHSHNLPDDLPASRVVEYRAALKEAKDALFELEEALEPSIPDPTLLDRLAERLKGIRGKLVMILTAGATAATVSLGSAAGSDIYSWLVDEGLPSLSRSIRGASSATPQGIHPKASGKR